MSKRKRTDDAEEQGARPLDTEEIVAAALRVIEGVGVEGFTMRRLAEELGRSPMATYRYVGTKDELLSLAADSVLAKVDLAGGRHSEWSERFAAQAFAVWEQVYQYPWVPKYLLDNQESSPGLQRIFNALNELFEDTTLDEEGARSAIILCSSFVAGLLSWLPREGQSREGPVDHSWVDQHLAFGVSTIAAGLQAR